jgi:hypothetical protein
MIWKELCRKRAVIALIYSKLTFLPGLANTGGQQRDKILGGSRIQT